MRQIILFLIFSTLTLAQVDSLRFTWARAAGGDIDSTRIYADTSWNGSGTPTTLITTVGVGTEEYNMIAPYTGKWIAHVTHIDTADNESIASNTDTTTAYQTDSSVIDTFYSGSGHLGSVTDGVSSKTGQDTTMSGAHDDETRDVNEDDAYNDFVLQASTTNDQFQWYSNCFFTFDTSLLPDDAVIDSVSLYVYMGKAFVQMGEFDISIVDINPDPSNFGNLVSGEMNNYGSTKFSTLNSATISDSYCQFEFNAAGIANVNVTGKVAYILEFDDVLDENWRGSWSSGAYSGISVVFTEDATRFPYLRIVYH